MQGRKILLDCRWRWRPWEGAFRQKLERTRQRGMPGEGKEFQAEQPVQMSRGSKKVTSLVNLKIVGKAESAYVVHSAILYPLLLLTLYEDFKGSQVIMCLSHHSHHRP